MPSVPRSTMMADMPDFPPRLGSVRTTKRFRFAPSPSQPPVVLGQYFRPLRTYSSPSRVAVRPIPAGAGSGTSKFAVPLWRPDGSETPYPATNSPDGSDVAA